MSTEDSSQFSPPEPGMTHTGSQRTAAGGIPWQPPTVEHLQSLLPQFEIIELLGHGGMGAVYKARQITLNRLVAIKLLPPAPSEEGNADFVERFKNEARTMAMFMHPAIVAVFDFGETSEGQPYFIMEFVEGTDVQKMVLSQGRLTADYAIGITAHVCDALQYAHSRGVIHRDIKPANVLINMEGQVKVADFGLAKMGETHGDETNMTMGTPDYIAPEALYMGVEIDHRADLFSVGVMLYNMLTGEIPRGEYQLASKIAGCDVRYDAIIARALQPDREHRYQSALEIRHDLDKILTTPVVEERPQKIAAGPKPRGPRVPARFHSTAPVKESSFTRLVPAVLTIGIASAAAWFFIFKPAAEQDKTNNTTPGQSPDSTASQTPASATGSTPSVANSTPGKEPPMTVPGAPTTNPATEPGKGPPPAPQPVLPAELTELLAQFKKLQTERVTAPFDADVARLNAGYLGGLDRESANEKAAGHPDAVQALEEEKKLVQAAGPVRLDTNGPVTASAEEDKSQGALKKLRGIYRLEMAKLDAQRAANESAVRASNLASLKQLEVDLTKAGRLADAKTVMDYREGPSPAKTTPAHNMDGLPANALVIEALIDGPSELRVTKNGIYWINIKGAKPGRHLGTKEPTYINGEPWQPQWKNEGDRNEMDFSNTQAISPPMDTSALELQLISVKTKRGDTGIDKRDALKLKMVGDEFSVLIPDSQGGSRWYKFALVPAAPKNATNNSAAPADLIGTWRFTWEKNGWSEQVAFNADGTFTTVWQDKKTAGAGAWQVVGDKIVLDYTKGGKEEMFLPLNPKGTKVIQARNRRELVAVKETP